MDELFLQVQNFKKPQTLEEMNQQLGLICDAIEKCQKMMQHLAVGAMDGEGSSSELSQMMSQHMQLIRMKEELSTIRNDTLQSQNLDAASMGQKRDKYSGWFATIVRAFGRKNESKD